MCPDDLPGLDAFWRSDLTVWIHADGSTPPSAILENE